GPPTLGWIMGCAAVSIGRIPLQLAQIAPYTAIQQRSPATYPIKASLAFLRSAAGERHSQFASKRARESPFLVQREFRDPGRSGLSLGLNRARTPGKIGKGKGNESAVVNPAGRGDTNGISPGADACLYTASEHQRHR